MFRVNFIDVKSKPHFALSKLRLDSEGVNQMATKPIKMSAAGLAKLKEELNYLITVRRAEVAQALKEARSQGDLSENAEYDEAKNEQGILEARIKELQQTCDNAIVVDESELSNDEVGVGSVVTLLDLEMDEEMTLQIVSLTEADPENGKISDESPIGMACLKKRVDDEFEVEVPVGTIKLKVLSISK